MFILNINDFWTSYKVAVKFTHFKNLYMELILKSLD